MSKSTFNAFLAREIDSKKAEQLIKLGYKVSSLKLLSVEKLNELGLSDSVIEIIQHEKRPPIPNETITSLLHSSKRTCCICRDSSKSVIIHHIEEWHISKNHSEDNLVVLCLQHHDEAHTQKALSLNLSKEHIKASKKKWIETVITQDAKTILGLMSRYSRWDYVNITRVFELFINFKIPYIDIWSYPKLLELSIIDNNGIFQSVEKWDIPLKRRNHFCDFGEGPYVMDYLKTIVSRIVEKLPIIDLTNNLNVSFIKSTVKVGDIITAQLGYYFKDVTKDIQNKKVELRQAYYRNSVLRIEFLFDPNECTSSSARFDALTGRKIAVPIIYVREITEEKGKLIINGSCLAIGTYFDNHRS